MPCLEDLMSASDDWKVNLSICQCDRIWAWLPRVCTRRDSLAVHFTEDVAPRPSPAASSRTRTFVRFGVTANRACICSSVKLSLRAVTHAAAKLTFGKLIPSLTIYRLSCTSGGQPHVPQSTALGSFSHEGPAQLFRDCWGVSSLMVYPAHSHFLHPPRGKPK
eukprot:3102610-Rhodomonas_salina.2